MLQAEDKVRFLAEATEQIINLFSTLMSHVDEVQWDSRAVDDFLNILKSRQLKELKTCVSVEYISYTDINAGLIITKTKTDPKTIAKKLRISLN